MSMNTTSNVRSRQLDKAFDAILKGKQPLTPRNGTQFLEAICAQEDPVLCVSKLTISDIGLDHVQQCMRFDLSIAFMNGPATKFLQYIQAPEIKGIGGGEFLSGILTKIVDPPFFWKPFTQAFRNRTLHEEGQTSFAWLLLQLMLLPGPASRPYRELAEDSAIQDIINAFSSPKGKAICERIKNVLATYGSPELFDDDSYHPGGRHDNDFADFHDISIIPTADEITSVERSFIRPSVALDDPKTQDSRLAIYLDNQFRLLREDMLYEMREELQISLGKKKGYRRGVDLVGFKLQDVHCGKDNKRCNWGLQLQCHQDLPHFKQVKMKDRRKHLDENPKVLRHQSLSCLIIDGDVVAFPIINRDEDLLAKNPPIIVVQLDGEASTTKTLLKLKKANNDDIRLIQIDTAIFSYEPVLKALQVIKDGVPLAPELLFWKQGDPTRPPPCQPTDIVRALQEDSCQDLQGLLKTPKSIRLDVSQALSLLSGLTQSVSLIQGPPGTGKSFIGALLAKILHDFTKQTVLVVCYTNHALDQFLEDLLDIGIPQTSIVRLGGKSTQRTAPLALQSIQKQNTGLNRTNADWAIIDNIKSMASHLHDRLRGVFKDYMLPLQHKGILDHIEFTDPEYFEAFRVPQAADGMVKVGNKGQAVNSTYLLERWEKGLDAGIFMDEECVRETSDVWETEPSQRKDKIAEWRTAIVEDAVADIYKITSEYNNRQSQLHRGLNATAGMILKSKRIIGCTTTGAAKYFEEIHAATPQVLLVEEAGEILESHILTALGAETRQMILIGDHKQLRPKVNHYLLTVEKGEGYNLNMSLFERLVLKGYPHKALTQQHRMRPEISNLIRSLTYPELVDAPTTKNRPNLRGVQNNIVFINHDHAEDEAPQLADRRDMSSTSSKQNTYEVEMILKILRYLAQQGYGTEKIVILTPYLGQLQKLRTALKKDNDPVLNDLDSYELVRAGLLDPVTAKMSKKPIRLATIDNYQGEESDIVLVSLTRSNTKHDIGFMSSPERLNVLLSRARNSLIMLGNAETFLKSRKGQDIWTHLFEMLRAGGHVYNGFPVKCEQHPDRTALLRDAAEFDKHCPDGGCNEPCGTKLSCDIHLCPSKCHQLYDHSKMACEHSLLHTCSKGHNRHYKCHQGPPLICRTCERQDKLAKEKQQKDFEQQQKRDAELAAHAQKIKEIDDQVALAQQSLRDAQLSQERDNAIRQKYEDLQAIQSQLARTLANPPSNAPLSSTVNSSVPSANSMPQQPISPAAAQTSKKGGQSPGKQPNPKPTTPSAKPKDDRSKKPPPSKSPSSEEWQRRKDIEGANNDAIDQLMNMIGLEDVKKQFLNIKDRIDVIQRQGTSLKDERFNAVFLGNPGTGKTTVARLYAKLLTSLQILPGTAFIETTGARLANDGVPGIKKTLEDVIAAGGGAIFIDEAYQLTGEHNFQGSQVLDFLLAEMENNVGTVVFILAGYNKQMEKFFEHNPGLTSRVPHKLQFQDYKDDELLEMLVKMIEKKWERQMKVEDGGRGLYCRVVVRRLGRQRGREGFGNARELQNAFSTICGRQADRIAKQRRKGMTTDDFELVKSDLIGPDPSQAKVECEAWTKLQGLIGLKTVKESIRQMFSLIETNYQRELKEKEPMAVSLNRVLLGSPGTGKTSVAKLYGRILADLGLLSNGEVVVKNPADFIGSVLGESESNTKNILASTVGKVLIIDEAYMLYGGGSSGGQQDPYKTAVIDTLVAEVQSVPGEDRCVLLLGYKAEIEQMFQNVNPGLSRRFAIENAFHFEDFTDPELLQILDLKLKDQDLDATDDAKNVAIEVLSRARNRPNFGNAGEVENLLSRAKVNYQTRQATLPADEQSFEPVFEPQDFDPEFDRSGSATTNLEQLFADIVGCDAIVNKLRGFQTVAHAMKQRGKDPRGEIPTNFVFKGPPGTGKTTIARKMGRVYYDMGILSSDDVVECSASDLIGQYVGQTGPKTKKLFEKALGKVLFVDEAYRLSEGQYAKEAMDELVGILTDETFKSKLVVILAGYDQEMNKLLAVNPGLSSRFQEDINFPNMTPKNCLDVLDRELKKKEIQLSSLEDPESWEYKELWRLIEELTDLPSWGNARDIVTLAKKMTSLVYEQMANAARDAELTLAGKDAIGCVTEMLETRRKRGDLALPSQSAPPPLEMFQPPPLPTQPTIGHGIAHGTRASVPTKATREKTETEQDGRDPGVTDAIWNQLQADKRQAELEEKRAKEAIEEETRRAEEEERKKKALAEEVARKKDAAQKAEAKRLWEEARIRELKARAKLAALEAERKREAEAQAKLREMGVCEAGYRWIKQDSGYRCSAGGHYVSNGQLGL